MMQHASAASSPLTLSCSVEGTDVPGAAEFASRICDEAETQIEAATTFSVARAGSDVDDAAGWVRFVVTVQSPQAVEAYAEWQGVAGGDGKTSVLSAGVDDASLNPGLAELIVSGLIGQLPWLAKS
jgi:hypothetical protein